MKKHAVLSFCGLYRYMLMRQWDESKPLLIFCMLNPSTADSEIDDPTIRKCIGFAHRMEYGGIYVVNYYAFRATKPADLWKAADPYGPGNTIYLIEAAMMSHTFGTPIVCAWGNHGGNWNKPIVLMQQHGGILKCFGLTKSGQPFHPLMLPYDTPLQDYKQ